MKKITPKIAALSYLSKGLSVIPVGKDKKPLFSWKEFTERRPTKAEIEKWWTEFPKAGVAIITGKISNLTVIDVEKDGQIDYLPPTLTIKTGGGGFHFYYRYCEKYKNAVRIRELTDIRNDGGYVIAPPSRHQSGNKYKISVKRQISMFPSHLFLTESLKEAKETRWEEIFKPAEKGERNARAASICGVILTKVPYSLREQVAWPALLNWNSNNDHPLQERELRTVFDSIASRVTFAQEDSEKEVKDIKTLIEDHKKKTEEQEKGELRCVTTGFQTLDEYLNGGWKKGELILIGARPSVGKTSLALTFASNAAAAGHSVLFFSIEMGSIDIFERLLSFVTKIPCSDIIKGEVKQEILEKGYDKIKKMKIDIAELAKADSNEVISVVKRILLEKKIDLIVVDYLQFLRDKNKGGTEAVRVGKISANLKMLARMTEIPVICPAQLNRKPEDRSNRECRISDLRDSGNLEQDADVVLLLNRNPEGDERANSKISIAKNRKGQTGVILATFDLSTTKFLEK